MRKIFFVLLCTITLSLKASEIAISNLDSAINTQENVEIFQFSSIENQQLALKLGRQLRCPQCQNQNLLESNSPLAQDLLLKVYQQVEQGSSEQEIIDHMMDRFGDMVHYQPPLNSKTLLLWFIPFIIVLIFSLAIIKKVKLAKTPFKVRKI